MRIETLKRALDDGVYSRAGLWGNEVIANLDVQKTYNMIKSDHQVFFVLPYHGENNPKAIVEFLSQTFMFSASVAGRRGQPLQLPIVATTYNVKASELSLTKLLDGKTELAERLLRSASGPFTAQQAGNQFLLIAALVVNELNVENAFKSLEKFTTAYPWEKRLPFRRCGGVGGPEARAAEQILHGYYYNTDTMLYICWYGAGPQSKAAAIKKAYDKTICSHLNENLDFGNRYSTTVYYRLLQQVVPSGTVALEPRSLPPEVQYALTKAPPYLILDGEKATWLYTLEDPAVYQTLSSALVSDDESRLQPWMSLMCLTKQFAFEHPTTEDIWTYRGSKISDTQFEALRVHAVYRDPKFVSTSISRDIAEKFQETYMCEYKIRRGCTNAVAVKFSRYTYEMEVLLPPYTPLLVIEKNAKEKVVRLAVFDDEAAAKHLESGEGRHAQGLHPGLT
ncbi:hypothetical protein MMC11_009112 [Xylographa trunciseda]|nr:hypothetical protein [Xylographa trunciseda]